MSQIDFSNFNPQQAIIQSEDLVFRPIPAISSEPIQMVNTMPHIAANLPKPKPNSQQPISNAGNGGNPVKGLLIGGTIAIVSILIIRKIRNR